MDFYSVLDQNEIDGQGKDTEIIAENSDVDWTKVMIHPGQDVPAGNYNFMISFQVTVSATNNSILYRLVGSVPLAMEEIKIDRNVPTKRFTYGFNLSWDGGLFELDIEMAKINTNFTATADFAEFSLTRRS